MKYGFDNFLNDSKDILDKLGGKANTAVSGAKAYVDKAQLKMKMRDKYAELGKLCYDMHKHDTDETGNMKILIKEIQLLENELEHAEDMSGRPRICQFCGSKNNVENTFCSSCGERL